MRMHQVEVDDDIFSFVQGHAEPLVDTFNTALRRLLPLGARISQRRAEPRLKANAANGGSLSPSFPGGTPQALRHILEVAQLVRGRVYTRTAATRFVAKQHGVRPQTVLDKYCRQLGLTANQFDRLLEQNDLADLRHLLMSKFPAHTDLIDGALDLGDGGVSEDQQ